MCSAETFPGSGPVAFMGKTILIVDDDQRLRQLTRRLLEGAGYTCFEAGDGLSAVEQAMAVLPDVVLADLRIPNLNGAELASVLKQRIPKTKIILMTLHEVGPLLRSIPGISTVIAKPELAQKLLPSIQYVLESAEGTPARQHSPAATA